MKGISDEISAVLRSAEELGFLRCPAVPATRTKLCLALAAIEISQLILNWMCDDRAQTPHLGSFRQ
jgi:hypothetical protein